MLMFHDVRSVWDVLSVDNWNHNDDFIILFSTSSIILLLICIIDCNLTVTVVSAVLKIPCYFIYTTINNSNYL